MHNAKIRREKELRQLASEGVPLRRLGKSGHWIVGSSLHIYTAAGRWFSEDTGRRGRLNGRPMRRIIDTEYTRNPGLTRRMLKFCERCPSASKHGNQQPCSLAQLTHCGLQHIEQCPL
ncbi:MAG: hypothetical protein JO270_23655 [Acidobacteriaceae bacterium]|nr:hypothetical protein [Acidobacteriaceae bacterium]